MSKDKGGKKEKKKVAADKSSLKTKAISSYKTEGNSSKTAVTIAAFAPKPDLKSGGKTK